MQGYLEVRYPETAMPSYALDILTSGRCALFFPVGFIKESGQIKGVYCTEGYRNLSAIENISTEDIFTVAISILHGVHQSEKLYLYQEMFALSPESVYVDQCFSTVKLIFIPAARQISLPEKLIGLLQELRKKGNPEGYGYLDDGIEFLRENQFGYQVAVHHLESLRKEVYLCNIA